MNKYIYIIAGFLFFIMQNVVCTQEVCDKKLVSLRQNEILEWEYDSTKGLLIYRVENNNKTIYDIIDCVFWDNWQVSKDRRKLLYWEDWTHYDGNDLPNLYILDGDTGLTTYLGKMEPGFTSADFKYFIYQDSSVEPKVRFVLYNFETKKNEKEFIWDLKSEKYFSQEENATYILRSNIPEYDFHIFIVSPGHYIFAEGYLSIKQNKMITIADDEGNDRILDLDSISKFEFGK